MGQVAVTLMFDNIEAIKRAVEAGNGISILPLPTIEKEVRAGSLTYHSLSDYNFIRPLSIIYNKHCHDKENVDNFIKLLQN